MESRRAKLMFISYAYSIGAVFVVLGHSTPTGISDLPFIAENIRGFIYKFHMPLFFFIAGLLFKYTSDKNKKPYKVFIKNKIVRFSVPYFMLSAIGIIPKILLSDYVNDNVSFNFYYIIEVIFNPRLAVFGHLWFLPTLLSMYVVSYLLPQGQKNKLPCVFVTIIAVILAVFPIGIDWLAIKDICCNFIYFYLGILMCNAVVKYRNKIFKLPISILTSAAAVVLHIYGFANVYLSNALSVVIAFLMMYSVFYLTVLFERKGCKLPNYLDGKTFSVYLLSWPVQAAIEVLLNRVLLLHWYITVPSMFLGGLAVPLLIIYIYKRLKYHPKPISLTIGFD